MTADHGLTPNVDRKRGGRRKAPVILQMEATECGAACIGMILAHYGRWVPLEELRVKCGVSRDGSKAGNMVRAAREYGLVAKGFKREPERVYDIPFPMIVFWEFRHFVVVEGVKGNTVYIVDPAVGPRKLTKQEFDEGFTGVCLGFEPESNFHRAGSPPNVYIGLLKRLGKTGAPLSLVLLATLVLVIPGLGIPTILKAFVDKVLIPGSTDLALALLIGLGLAALMQGALTWLQQDCIAKLEAKLAVVASARFFWHVLTLPMTFFGQRYAGDISDRVASNDRVASLLSSQLATNAVNLITMVIYGAVLLAYDIVLAAVAFAMTGLNILALRLASAARETGNRRMLKEQGRVASTSVSGLQMIESLKADGSENDFFTRWSGIHANFLSAQHTLGLATGLLFVVPPLLSSATTIAILGVGGLRILEGSITIGGLLAFQTIARSFAEPVEGVVQFGAELQVAKGEIARLDDVLNYPINERALQGINETKPSALPVAQGYVTLENVTFGYNVQEKPLIEDFSLRIKPGQRVALVGSSGSGKSTIGRLICGLQEPWSGKVLIDNIPIADLTPSQQSHIVSYVDQDVFLFEGTVRDNVTLWNPIVKNLWVTQALQDAALQDEIAVRHGNQDAQVDENGRNFSGGQRQRLEIARALALQPTILVLDEATAALDPTTELEIDDNLRRRGCTCVIVAHRLSTVRDADLIVVIEDGQIVQQGKHEKMIESDGPYRKLVLSS